MCISVCYEEGAERTPLDGDDRSEAAADDGSTEGAVSESLRRDLQVESLWEYGARRGIWRLLSVMDRHATKATFFCAGRALERNPEAARAIVEAGHEVAGHGYRYVPYTSMDAASEETDIRRGVSAIEALTGKAPKGWLSRSPSSRTRATLGTCHGLVYDADSMADDLPYFVPVHNRPWLCVPHSPDLDDARFWTAPGVPGFTSPDDFFTVLRMAFDRLYMESASCGARMMSLTLRPRNSGRPSRAGILDRFLTYVEGFADVWIARRVEVAEYWRNAPGHLAPEANPRMTHADHVA